MSERAGGQKENERAGGKRELSFNTQTPRRRWSRSSGTMSIVAPLPSGRHTHPLQPTHSRCVSQLASTISIIIDATDPKQMDSESFHQWCARSVAFVRADERPNNESEHRTKQETRTKYTMTLIVGDTDTHANSHTHTHTHTATEITSRLPLLLLLRHEAIPPKRPADSAVPRQNHENNSS